jgi:hypothetical protein
MEEVQNKESQGTRQKVSKKEKWKNNWRKSEREGRTSEAAQ